MRRFWVVISRRWSIKICSGNRTQLSRGWNGPTLFNHQLWYALVVWKLFTIHFSRPHDYLDFIETEERIKSQPNHATRRAMTAMDRKARKKTRKRGGPSNMTMKRRK